METTEKKEKFSVSYKSAFFVTLILLLTSILANILLGFMAIDRTIRVNELLDNDGRETITGMDSDRPGEAPERIPGSDKTSFVIKEVEMTIDETYDNYDIDGKYPVVSIDGYENRQITDAVESYLDDIRDQAQAEYGSDAQLFTEFEYEVHSARNGGTVSIVFDGVDYLGGAHPTQFRKTMVFDISPDRALLLDLEDLFIEGTDYLEQVSTLSKAALMNNDRIEDADLLEAGTAADEANYLAWHIQEENLVVYFGQYQVAPYVAGTFTVELPLSDLDGLVYPEF